tara:strand:- start:374 stop:655 length:282 start_codon:yes stop_codon:yes gene_type:complete
MIKTDTIKLSELQRPLFDPYTGGAFQGSHRDLMISRRRTGDTIVERKSWVRDVAGTFLNRREQTWSAAAMIDMAKTEGLKVVDDIPQGFSIAR